VIEKLNARANVILEGRTRITANSRPQSTSPVEICNARNRSRSTRYDGEEVSAQSSEADPKPSRDDIEMTREIKAAAEALGIAIHDHLVIGRKGHSSFKGLGLI
jgi:hypothetical protein